MLSRFTGPHGHRLLVTTLAAQEIIASNQDAAMAIADVARVCQHDVGSIIIEEGGKDNDLFFILTGTARVEVSRREVARRNAGQSVGEMALIDPAIPRTASVVATEACVVAQISEADFVQIADKFPRIWRNLALQLSTRLRQRNTLVRPVNTRVKAFIGSSSEKLEIAREIQAGLSHDPIGVTVWTDAVFTASHFAIDDLERQISEADFAVLVISADDQVSSRGQSRAAPRDNVIFELGLFVGGLGHKRTFIVKPRGVDIKLPSDLLGYTSLEYDAQELNVTASIAPVCTELRKLIKSLGCR
jgi:predicted nucleotide-binding protein